MSEHDWTDERTERAIRADELDAFELAVMRREAELLGEAPVRGPLAPRQAETDNGATES